MGLEDAIRTIVRVEVREYITKLIANKGQGVLPLINETMGAESGKAPPEPTPPDPIRSNRNERYALRARLLLQLASRENGVTATEGLEAVKSFCMRRDEDSPVRSTVYQTLAAMEKSGLLVTEPNLDPSRGFVPRGKKGSIPGEYIFKAKYTIGGTDA